MSVPTVTQEKVLQVQLLHLDAILLLVRIHARPMPLVVRYALRMLQQKEGSTTDRGRGFSVAKSDHATLELDHMLCQLFT